MKNIYQLLGGNIRENRIRLNLTQADLAEKADISINFLGHIERGTKKASLLTISKLAAALELQISELFKTSLTYKTVEETPLSKQLLFLLKDKNPSEIKNLLKVIKLISRKK